MITPKMDAYYEKIRANKRQEYTMLNRQTLVYPELIFLGDSITEWFPIDRLLRLNKIWVNRGIAASNSQHLLEHLDVHVFGNSVTDLVLLIGTNDLGYGRSIEAIAHTVRQLLEAIKAEHPLVTVHLLEVLPVHEAPNFQHTVDGRTNAMIRALNRVYADLADELMWVNLVQTHAAFLDDDGQLAQDLTKDGLHLSDQGYQLLADLLAPVLGSL